VFCYLHGGFPIKAIAAPIDTAHIEVAIVPAPL
jgi:hypothetical protein